MNPRYLIIITAFILGSCSSNQETSDAYGNFETEEIIVSSEAAGKLLEFSAQEGDMISQGQILGWVDTLFPALNIRQLEVQKTAVLSKKINIAAQIEVLKEQKKAVEINRARLEKLYRDGAATAQQLDDVKSQLRILDRQSESIRTQYTLIESELKVLDSKMDLLIEQMKRCQIVSDVKGTVLQTFARKGELTTAGKPLLKLADLSSLTLKVYISGAQMANVKIGQQVEVLIDKDEKQNQKLKGTVSWISDEAEFTPKIIQTKEERVKLVYAMKVRVPNDGRLKIGMPGEVNFK
ncbi:MAG: HlyD family efflux transporter periplasmic adaptor subunit [Bacteroidales bacterium]|nr:HlyD family efflux transporter periplasmic adaptor subunit [Bacteroidales bacterium]